MNSAREREAGPSIRPAKRHAALASGWPMRAQRGFGRCRPLRFESHTKTGRGHVDSSQPTNVLTVAVPRHPQIQFSFSRDTEPVSTSRITAPNGELRRAKERFLTRTDGAETYHSFSFGDHYDPTNVSFGRLMVNNDDLVRVGAGYPDHPHRDAEIVTWVLSGSLVHEDSYGNSGLIYPGLAQRMSAGSGIVHAERNDAYRVDPTRPAEPVHFIQMWIRPEEYSAQPSYQQRELALGDLVGDWLPVASSQHPDTVVSIASAGSTLWASVLPAGTSRWLPQGDLLHVYLVRGVVDVETVGPLQHGDSLRLSGSTQLGLTAREEAEVLVWEMALELGDAR